jgi:phospholipid/cholesterol/gamma-HCH transport system permease protein
MRELIDLRRIGGNAINAVLHSKGTYALLAGAFGRVGSLRNAPVRQVLYRQIYFTGVEALSKITVIGALVGIVIITQVSNIVGLNVVLTGKVLIWAVVRVLGPLMAAIIIIARSCTAVAAELGSMRVNREMDYLASMGIDPMDYLIVPRVVGITFSVFVLTFYFQVVAIAGGLVLSSVFVDIPFLQQLRDIFSILGLFEVGVALLKSAVFGLVISSSSCYHGLHVRTSITEIPQATTKAVMQSLFLVFIFDGVITIVSFI